MSDQDRLDRLERRVLQLENLMRRLLQEAPQGTVAPTAAAPAAEPRQAEESPAPRPFVAAPEVGAPGPVTPAPLAAPAPALDGEQWVGQRGLLAVGVVAVVLAAGYLLKLSFDRGWISPAMRCLGGALAEIAIGALGWSLTTKG